MTLDLNEHAVTGFLEECYRQGFNEKQAAYLLERSLDTSDVLEKRALGPSQNASVDWTPFLQLLQMLSQQGGGNGMNDFVKQLFQMSGGTTSGLPQTDQTPQTKAVPGTGWIGDWMKDKKFYNAGDSMRNKPHPPQQKNQQQPGATNTPQTSSGFKPLPSVNFGTNGGQLTLEGMNQPNMLNPNGSPGTLNIDMTGKGTMTQPLNFSQPSNTGTQAQNTPNQPNKPTTSVPPQQPNNPTRPTPSTQPGGAPQNGTPGGSNPPATAGGAPQNATPGGGASAPSGKPETVKYNYGDPVKNKFTTNAYGVTHHFLELENGKRIQVNEHTYNGATTRGENGDLVNDPAGDKDRQLAQQLSKQLGENVEEAETGVAYGVPYTRAKVNGQWRDLSGRNYYTPPSAGASSSSDNEGSQPELDTNNSASSGSGLGDPEKNPVQFLNNLLDSQGPMVPGMTSSSTVRKI